MRGRGFTLVELLVVLAALALLLSVAAPRYVQHVQRGREAVLRQNLATMRDAIDKFRADKGRYPQSLDELVTAHYLRQVPMDPTNERIDTWLAVPPAAGEAGQLYDIHSGSTGKAVDGTPYAQW